MVIRIEKSHAAAVGALLALIGALALPLLSADFDVAGSGWLPESFGPKLREWLAGAGVLPQRDLYLLGMLQILFQRGEILLTLLIGLIAVVLPAASVAACLWLAFAGPLGSSDFASSTHPVRILAATTRWAMADVFLIALLIVLVAADSLRFQFSAAAGTYCYAAMVVLAMAAQRLTLPDHPGHPLATADSEDSVARGIHV